MLRKNLAQTEIFSSYLPLSNVDWSCVLSDGPIWNYMLNLICISLHWKKKLDRSIEMHQPGIEPGSVPWQGTILPLDHWCWLLQFGEFYQILLVRQINLHIVTICYSLSFYMDSLLFFLSITVGHEVVAKIVQIFFFFLEVLDFLQLDLTYFIGI